MAQKAEKRQKTLASLQVDLAEIGDEIWNHDTVPNLDDSTFDDTGQQTASQDKAGEDPAEFREAADQQPDPASSSRRPGASTRRPARATKFRTREEIFEHRMAVMAHRRAQLEAHRNRQTRNWYAFTGALLIIGVSGLGGFYYKSNDWKFLSSYSFGTTEIQNLEIASAAQEEISAGQSSSSHFQNASAAALLQPAKVQQPVEEVTDIPVVKIPQQLETLVEKIAKQPPREPVAPKVIPQTPAAPNLSVAEVAPVEQPPQKAAEAEVAQTLVRIAPTAGQAPVETVYNLNKAPSTGTALNRDADGEWVMVPVETKIAQPNQVVASLSPRITAPKTGIAAANTGKKTRSDDDAIETALSLPPKALDLGAPALTDQQASSTGLLAPLLASDGKDVSILLDRGDQLLLLGDIVSARQLYQHAFQQGNARAAARIGTTYDPRIFAQLGVHGLRPDSKKALDWYNKAVDAGDETARQPAQTLSAQISKP